MRLEKRRGLRRIQQLLMQGNPAQVSGFYQELNSSRPGFMLKPVTK
jgi:hypothetical protein